MTAETDQTNETLDVIVIEDNPADARLIREYLQSTQPPRIEIRHETTFEAGLELCRTGSPDAVIVDLTLPEHAPQETLDRVAELPDEVAVVILTGSNDDDVGRRALRQGADGYLDKEFLEPDLLRTTLENAVERSRLLREHRITRRAVEAANDGVLICNARQEDAPIVFCNSAFEEMTGYDEREMIGHNCRFLQCEETSSETVRELAQAIDEQRSTTVEILNERKDGSRFWNQLSISPIRNDRGETTHFVGIQNDVTRRVEAERGIRAQKRELETYETIIENTTDAVTVTNPEGKLHFLNETYADLFGESREALLGRKASELFAEEHVEREVIAVREGEAGEPSQRIEESIETDGETRIFSTTEVPFEEDDRTIGTIRIRRDITERKQAQQKLQHQATHDNLTELPNRMLFRNRLTEAVDSNRPFAIGFIDLDNFKAVNDSLGHASGDTLLEHVADRLDDKIRDDDMVARVGGDEFTCLLEGIGSHEELEVIARRLTEMFEPPFQIDGAELHLSASIGFARLKREQLEDAAFVVHADSLRRAADRAMYRAKNRPGTAWETFDHSSRGGRSQRMQRENQIRTGLERGEFFPHYQPMYQLEDGVIVCLETLARWEHPEQGLVSPGEFIPLAERAALIDALCESLIEQSYEHARRWVESYPVDEPITLFFNLSPVQISKNDAIDSLLAAARPWKETEFSIGFEVTETNLLKYSDRIERLRDAGYAILVDDFGTGYSSFSRLKELQVDGLKLDMQFVLGMMEDEADEAIVETMVDLGHRLDIPIIAEGIESDAQLERLREMECTIGQGFHLTRPTDFEGLIEVFGDGYEGGILEEATEPTSE